MNISASDIEALWWSYQDETPQTEELEPIVCDDCGRVIQNRRYVYLDYTCDTGNRCLCKDCFDQ